MTVVSTAGANQATNPPGFGAQEDLPSPGSLRAALLLLLGEAPVALGELEDRLGQAGCHQVDVASIADHLWAMEVDGFVEADGDGPPDRSVREWSYSLTAHGRESLLSGMGAEHRGHGLPTPRTYPLS